MQKENHKIKHAGEDTKTHTCSKYTLETDSPKFQALEMMKRWQRNVVPKTKLLNLLLTSL